MRVFITGGGGFIGQAVVRALLARGDQVTAAIRDPARATLSSAPGLDVLRSDLRDPVELRRQLGGHDALVHLAGVYRIGIRKAERPAMWEANAATTERVLDAAQASGVGRIVHVSTGNVLGNSGGRVLDEAHHRDLRQQPFLSFYDETKVRAHEIALGRAARGAPLVIAMPGTVYGPRDHSGIGQQLRLAFQGKLRYRVLDDLGTSLVHVDDEADGLLRVLDRGRIGESYILAGQTQRLVDALRLAARLGGHSLTRVTVPTAILRTIAPLAPLASGRGDLPANLGEVISAGSGVTYWLSSAKAKRELGFVPRDLEAGLRDTFLADGPSRAGGAVT